MAYFESMYILLRSYFEVLCSLTYVKIGNISFKNFSTESTNMVVKMFVVPGVVIVVVGIPDKTVTHAV